MSNRAFSKKIIGWYEENKRSLPWRDTTDPYKIWLSEIILQQTRVAQGLPYYERFIKTFPTVFDLANAPQQQVLRLWQGLGYYSRARNLHTCAKSVVKDFGGKFPGSYNELTKLKGVGPYTAAAIASIAFKEAVAVVDGNVFRVLSRIFGIEKDIGSNEGKAFFFAKANELIPQDQPDLFNQAVMEFGALHCLPQNPKCDTCVFVKTCVANQHDLKKVLPFKSKKLKVRNRYFYYFVIRHQSKILMKKREGKDIWQGLYDFYLVETKRNSKTEVLLKENKLLKGSTKISESKIYKHILSHQKLMVRFIELELPSSKISSSLGLKWFTKKQVAALPKPILIAKYLTKDKIFYLAAAPTITL
jgi:A/G-specific adenine glycosylase